MGEEYDVYGNIEMFNGCESNGKQMSYFYPIFIWKRIMLKSVLLIIDVVWTGNCQKSLIRN
ncbi:hypothetical protein LL12F52_26510 [Escherichia coli]